MKIHYLWFILGGIFYLAPLFFLWQYVKAQHLPYSPASQTAINVLDYGASGDGTTDDGNAFAKAFADAHTYNLPVYLPKKTYLIDRTLAIQPGMVIRSDGAILKHTRSDLTFLSATNANEWVIQGPLTLSGTRTAPRQQDRETGLFISGCSHYIVDKLTLQDFKGKGIEIDTGELGWSVRGNHGQYAFVTFINNSVGLQIDQSIGAEYNLFTLLSFSGNDVASTIASGNTVISTSNIVDNENGVLLSAGSNHGHGIFNATNINHNTGFNIKSEEVVNGYTFNGCHIYGDSDKTGIIQLTRSNGIHIIGGTLDAAIVDDGEGANMVSDEFITGDNFSITGENSKAVRTQCLFDQNKEKHVIAPSLKPAH